MPDNYDCILDFIEKSTDGMDIDSEEFKKLTKEISSFDKRELRIYCQTKLKKVREQLAFRNFIYAMLGGLSLRSKSKVLSQKSKVLVLKRLA